MGTTTKSAKSQATAIPLSDLEVVYDGGQGERRIPGELLARLITFAEALAPTWTSIFTDVEDAALDLQGLAALLHRTEQADDAHDAASLHSVEHALEYVAARLYAARESVASLARYRVKHLGGILGTREERSHALMCAADACTLEGHEEGR